jgi:hypothetical protein
MNPTFVLWFVIGVMAGCSHAWMLWRASRLPFHGAAWHPPRLLVIGGVLVASAVWGGLLPAVTGWMAAYFATLGIVAIRSPR